jgi:hypothetical protein
MARKMAFAIKTDVAEPIGKDLVLARQKTMYGGKTIAAGDLVFVFASENEGGQGLIAKGVVTSAEAVPKRPDLLRQTPRVSLSIRCLARATQPLGRVNLKTFDTWTDGKPETELNFKLYRQATNKIIGISDAAKMFLLGYF